MIWEALSLVTPPSGDVVTVDEVKTQLGIPGDDSDEALALDLMVATQFFDGPQGYLGRALLTQTWDYTLHRFPYYGIYLPLPPLVSIVSISYYDLGGSLVTIDPSSYSLAGVGGRGSVNPVAPPWPVTFWRKDAIKVRFVAGYANAAAVPGPIKKAIVLKLAQLRGLSKSDAMLKQESVIGVSSQMWDTSEGAFKLYDGVIDRLISGYMERHA